jgi:hypothetical protein
VEEAVAAADLWADARGVHLHLQFQRPAAGAGDCDAPIGALIGALITATVGRPSWPLLIGGGAAFSALLMVLAPLHWVVACALMLVVTGVAFTTYTSMSIATSRASSPLLRGGRVPIWCRILKRYCLTLSSATRQRRLDPGVGAQHVVKGHQMGEAQPLYAFGVSVDGGGVGP